MGGFGSNYIPADYSKNLDYYNKKFNRVYGFKEAEFSLPLPINKYLYTASKMPIIINVDVTGSMGDSPKIFFKKACVLQGELRHILPEELKNDFEISVGATGDVDCDRAPIQITDFSKNADLDDCVQMLWGEGGGDDNEESYGMSLLYYALRLKMPNAQKERKRIRTESWKVGSRSISVEIHYPKPLVFMWLDDEPVEPIGLPLHNGIKNRYSSSFRGSPLDAFGNIKHFIGIDRNELLSKFGETEEIRVKMVLTELQKIAKVFMLGCDYNSRDLVSKWAGSGIPRNQFFTYIPKERVSDVIVGLVAKEVGTYEIFKERLKVRQPFSICEEIFNIIRVE